MNDTQPVSMHTCGWSPDSKNAFSIATSRPMQNLVAVNQPGSSRSRIKSASSFLLSPDHC